MNTILDGHVGDEQEHVGGNCPEIPESSNCSETPKGSLPEPDDITWQMHADLEVLNRRIETRAPTKDDPVLARMIGRKIEIERALRVMNQVKAEAVMRFVSNQIGSYASGFIDSPACTIGDIYQDARNHVRDSYGVMTQSLAQVMGEDFARECAGKEDGR